MNALMTSLRGIAALCELHDSNVRRLLNEPPISRIASRHAFARKFEHARHSSADKAMCK